MSMTCLNKAIIHPSPALGGKGESLQELDSLKQL